MKETNEKTNKNKRENKLRNKWKKETETNSTIIIPIKFKQLSLLWCKWLIKNISRFSAMTAHVVLILKLENIYFLHFELYSLWDLFT